MTNKKDKDVFKSQEEFLRRAHQFVESITAGKTLPEEIRLREKEGLLASYQERLKFVEKAQQRLSNERENLMSTIARTEKEIKAYKKTSKRKKKKKSAKKTVKRVKSKKKKT